MTTEQLILQELRKLTGRVEQLEKELAQLKTQGQILGPKPYLGGTYPHPDNPDIILGGVKIPEVCPKLIDGHDALFMPFEVTESESSKQLREDLEKYREDVEKLWEYWRQNPDKAPKYGDTNAT